jgi:hypothetical protein
MMAEESILKRTEIQRFTVAEMRSTEGGRDAITDLPKASSTDYRACFRISLGEE